MHRSRFSSAVVFVSLSTGSLIAQAPQARIAINAGTATDVTGLRSQAMTIAPAVTIRPDANTVLALRGSGTRFDNGGWAAVGGAALGARRPAGRVTLTFDAAGDYTATSYDRSFLTGDAVPGLEIPIGPVTVFGAGHASLATVRGQAAVREDPFGALTDREVSVTRTGMTALAGVAARLWPAPEQAVTASIREERGTVADVRQIDRSASLNVVHRAMTISGTVGERSANDARSAFGTIGASVAVRRDVSIEAAGGRYAANPLTGAAAGSFASVGASVRFGQSAPRIPRPAGIAPPPAGVTRVAVRAEDAVRVEVAGDFNRWTFVPARRAANGVWYADLEIPPGEYRYAFRVDGGAWRIPDGVAAASDDDFGGRSALLVVPPSAGRARQ